MVDMEVPSAYVQFLRSLMPRKPRNEIYNALGLAKQGKTLFYRDFLYHLKHSSDKFRIAPGIKGMVMLVFDLPSFPYVFKVIKDYYPPQKDTTREQIKGKYLLVKQHDRVGPHGRHAGIQRGGVRARPLRGRADRGNPRVRAEPAGDQRPRRRRPRGSRHQAPLHRAPDDPAEHLPAGGLRCRRAAGEDSVAAAQARDQIERAVIEYGNAIKDLVAANIFPGDMLWKNFGVTRNGKVVFYDYDEIEYITDCNFRKIPQAHNEEEEMSGEVWYRVGPKDVFPETFGPFLLGNPAVREVFMKHHADLLEASFWQAHKERIQAGHVYDVFPYEREKRFARRHAAAAAAAPAQSRSQRAPSGRGGGRMSRFRKAETEWP